jgi:hypothetical protein
MRLSKDCKSFARPLDSLSANLLPTHLSKDCETFAQPLDGRLQIFCPHFFDIDANLLPAYGGPVIENENHFQ